ncbi:MAG TPA: MFS transporter [Afifellaceae bacterium]|nr:MFS transporter [Afifellaceae bacterium]
MPVPPGPRQFAGRTAVFYGALFFATGIYLPFFPVWLAGQGLSEPEIAIIVAAPFFIRVVVNPVLTVFADRFADLNIAGGVYGLLAASVFAGLSVASGFWPILLLSAGAMVLWSVLIPIGDAVAIVGVRRHQMDYGRVRLWGSVTFMLANFVTAEVLLGFSDNGVFGLQTAAFIIGGMVAFWLPGVRDSQSARGPARLKELFADPVLRRAVLAGSLVLATHGTYYTFGSLYWRELGFGARTIAALWAYSVIIEICLFWAAKRLTGWGARRFLIAGGIGALVRWSLFPLASVPALAFALQTLHSLTFAATYLGVIMAIGANAAPGHTARLQAGFQLVSGVIGAFAILSAGPMFRHSPYLAFWAMAALGTSGALLAWHVQRGMQPPPEQGVGVAGAEPRSAERVEAR